MDKGTYILNEDREQMVEFVTSQQVVNGEFYSSLTQYSPMLAKMMLDKFKDFLNDSYFTSMERQTLLMKFFENHDNIDIIKEILEFIQKCERKEDYTKIVMEYMYHNSEDIIKANLAKVDGVHLYEKKQKNKIKIKDPTDDFVQNLLEITKNFLDGNGGTF